MNNIYVNTRSSIKITGSKTIYFDPLEIQGEPTDADIIFVTHVHYDHFSPEDIRKVMKDDTKIIVPVSMLEAIEEKGLPTDNLQGVQPGQAGECEGVTYEAIPAYNIGKAFHPKENNWVSYLVEMDGVSYYAMGDTDVTPEAEAVDVDVIFVPVGGKYTMDADEAAKFINQKPRGLVVPIHYGEQEACDRFIGLLDNEVKTKYLFAEELIRFRLEANVNTYAAFMNEVDSTRLDSHDFRYEKGDYVYHDTYVGGEQFAGQEAVWKKGKAVYAMNYAGRVLSDKFSGNFLKEALRKADVNMPYRGPEYYQAGEYTYKAKVSGDIDWFQGYEEIYWQNEKVYECYFHGGVLR